MKAATNLFVHSHVKKYRFCYRRKESPLGVEGQNQGIDVRVSYQKEITTNICSLVKRLAHLVY